MPFYDYECENKDCKHTFEEFQSIVASKLKTCPKCKKDTLVRLIGGGVGFILKGDGFFANDYPKEK
jgi:putative FmdB family regulatory protein